MNCAGYAPAHVQVFLYLNQSLYTFQPSDLPDINDKAIAVRVTVKGRRWQQVIGH